MEYELCDHTADIAVAATGDSLESTFAAVANGLAAASCDEDEIGRAGERFSVSVVAENREALLFDYLDELIYRRDVRGELPVDHRVDAIDEPDETSTGRNDDSGAVWQLEASARGVPLAGISAREIKAVTYSEMRLERTDDDWEAYVVFDV
ncbi:archease [Natrarchaeobius chitinivorans]|uniref:Archease n=1 Tax=Natrarchaeobius chitinivorans TaxID=1679083 RepID=A0A3N6PA00_NATCH|nr:archease [Natrarchaeobius chitinivorans]RQG95849.1 archease [Natrarchaeobius chitinivorans]